MKKILLMLAAGLFLIQLVSAQSSDTTKSRSPKEVYDYYSSKRSTNNGVGWLLLGSGVIMQIGGAASAASQPFILFATQSSDYNKNRGLGLFIVGLGTALASIPFFISAHSNKIKARLALETRNVSFNNTIIPNSNYTVIVLKVPL